MMSDDKYNNIATEPDFSYGAYTYADYLNFRMDDMVEVIRGKLFRMSPAPGSAHQMISSNLHIAIGKRLFSGACRIFSAPYDVILPIPKKDFSQSQTVVQPDLCVVCDAEKIQEKGCFGAPDWVVEILSPHTSKKDIQLKYEVYEEAGVKEYWMVMPRQQVLEIFVLDAGKYRRYGAYAWEDTVAPFLFPELQIPLCEIFEERAEW